MSSPKLFISYSWSDSTHEQWVIELATELRESGVDVILDKWDLKEGHDAVAFMEKMVTDPEIKKDTRSTRFNETSRNQGNHSIAKCSLALTPGTK